MSSNIDVLDFAQRYLIGAAEVYATPNGGVTFSRLPLYTDALHLNHMFMNEVTRTGSGVRFEFETTASFISLKLECSTLRFPGAPAVPVVVDLEVNGVVTSHRVDPFEVRHIDHTDAVAAEELPTLNLALGEAGVSKQVRIWLPQNAHTTVHSVSTDGDLRPLAPRGPHWLHYGSSISQASEVEHPSAVWPAVAAAQLGLQLRSLGLGGNALLDPFIGDVIVAAAPELISLKLGINIVNANSATVRTFPALVHGLLDTIRRGLPTTPILLITPIHCPPHEEGFGPTVFDMENFKATASPAGFELFPSSLNLRIIREQLSAIFGNRAATDPNLHFMQGTDLFGEADAHLLPDDLHPNHEGYQLLAQRFASHPIIDAWQKHQ